MLMAVGHENSSENPTFVIFWVCIHNYLHKGDYVFTHVHLLVGWFDYTDYTKTTERISTKLGWRIGLSPDLLLWIRKKKDEKFFSPSLALWDNAFFQIFVKFSRNNPWILMEKLKKRLFRWLVFSVSGNTNVGHSQRYGLYRVPF